MSDSVRPHRWQPTRLRRPWDSPGKNTGVGCHFLLQCMKVKSESEVAQSCLTLSHSKDYSLPGSSIHGFSRQEYWTGVPLPSPDSALEINKYGLCSLWIFSSAQFSHSVMSDSLQPYELQHSRPPCPSPTPRVHSNLCPSSR